jgi:xylulokinase
MDAVTVGLDIGTTSIKAVAVDSDGRVLRRARIPHEVLVPAPDRLEHDAVKAWRNGPKRALRALGPVEPSAIAVTAMVPSVTAVDRRGRPLTAGLLYGDGRGRAHSVELGDAAIEGTSGSEVAGFLAWSSETAPDAAGYWPAQAVANKALGASPAVDMAVAFIASPLYGPEGWDPALARRCGVRPEQLPLVDIPGAAVGRLDGRAGNPLVTAGSVDVWCEQLVAGAADVGDVHVVCGTTLIVWAVGSVDSGAAPHPGVWTVPHSQPGNQMIGGASNAGGLFLDWSNRLTGLSRLAGQPPVRPGQLKITRDRLVADDVPVWVPYLRGERTPYHDPDRRAALHDLNLTHGAAAIQRAAWEASAFVVRHHLELARVPGRRIVATGGGTKVEGWMQALADATGLPVHVAAEPEGAARGAAYLARVAAGLETDLEGAARWASTREVVEPEPDWAKAADARYLRFLELSGPVPEPSGDTSPTSGAAAHTPA